MKTQVDARLAAETARFDLRFACEDCVHFAPERDPTCGHGWPLRLHRSAIPRGADADGANELQPEPLSFCKEFELA